MRVPRQFRAVKPALTFTAPEVRYIKAGCYSSNDDIMEAIVKSATRNDNEKLPANISASYRYNIAINKCFVEG